MPDLPCPAESGVDLRILAELAVLRFLGWHTVALWFRTTRERADPSQLLKHADEVICGGARVERFTIAHRASQRLASFSRVVTGRTAPTYPYALRYDAVGGRDRVAAAIRDYSAEAVLLPTFLVHWAPAARSAGAEVIGDSYDVQSVYARALFNMYAPRKPWRAPGLAVNVFACKSQERLFLPMCREIWVTTPLEVEQVHQVAPNANVIVLGSGIDEDIYPQTAAPLNRIVGFIGNFDYGPNADAARDLALRIWPKIRGNYSDAILAFAGDGMGPDLRQQLTAVPGIRVLGRVSDAVAFTSGCRVLAMPIRTRGGLPLKLVEGLASGRAVVATPELVLGTGLQPGRDLLVASSLTDMAAAVTTLLGDIEAAARIGAAGRRAFEASFSLRAMKHRAGLRSVLGRKDVTLGYQSGGCRSENPSRRHG